MYRENYAVKKVPQDSFGKIIEAKTNKKLFGESISKINLQLEYDSLCNKTAKHFILQINMHILAEAEGGKEAFFTTIPLNVCEDFEYQKSRFLYIGNIYDDVMRRVRDYYIMNDIEVYAINDYSRYSFSWGRNKSIVFPIIKLFYKLMNRKPISIEE